jgi:hypothetical protein
MRERQPMSDVVVVVLPGISGSVLALGEDKDRAVGPFRRRHQERGAEPGAQLEVSAGARGVRDALPENEGEGEPTDHEASKSRAGHQVYGRPPCDPGAVEPHQGVQRRDGYVQGVIHTERADR